MTDEEWEQNRPYFKVTREAGILRVDFVMPRGVVQTSLTDSKAEQHIIDDAGKLMSMYIRDGIRRALKETP